MASRPVKRDNSEEDDVVGSPPPIPPRPLCTYKDNSVAGAQQKPRPSSTQNPPVPSLKKPLAQCLSTGTKVVSGTNKQPPSAPLLARKQLKPTTAVDLPEKSSGTSTADEVFTDTKDAAIGSFHVKTRLTKSDSGEAQSTEQPTVKQKPFNGQTKKVTVSADHDAKASGNVTEPAAHVPPVKTCGGRGRPTGVVLVGQKFDVDASHSTMVITPSTDVQQSTEKSSVVNASKTSSVAEHQTATKLKPADDVVRTTHKANAGLPQKPLNGAVKPITNLPSTNLPHKPLNRAAQTMEKPNVGLPEKPSSVKTDPSLSQKPLDKVAQTTENVNTVVPDKPSPHDTSLSRARYAAAKTDERAPIASFSEFDNLGLDPDLFRGDFVEEGSTGLDKTMGFKRSTPSPVLEEMSDRCPEEIDGGLSEDGLSDGGEFCEENVEFRRPAPDKLITSIPIVPSQQQRVFDRKGYLYKYTSEKTTLGKLGSVWLKRWVTIDSEALKYFSTNTSAISKRVIPVCTMANVEQIIKTGESHQFRFRLTTIDRVYHFATDTSDDLAWWTSILMRAILSSKEMFQQCGEMYSPDLASFLRLEGRRNKRYVVVKRGKLCLYNTISDFRVFSPIHQVELQLASVKDVGRCKLVLQMPQASFTFVFELQDELNIWKNAIKAGISYALGDDKILELVYANVSNRNCADCRAPGPEWGAVNMGVTICHKCAGVHRTLPTAKVRSLRMDCKVWKPSLIQLMKEIGNDNANSFWESTLGDVDRIDQHVDTTARSLFINNKYREMRFCRLHPLHNNQQKLNEALCNSARSTDILETMRLVFSGADTTFSLSNDENGTPLQLSIAAHQALQTEFLQQNVGTERCSTSSAKSLSPMSPKSTTKFEYSRHNREVNHCGYLYKLGNNSKAAPVKSWFVLQNGLLSCLEGDKSGEVKETIDQRDMISISATTDERVANVFELNTSKPVTRSVSLAAESTEDRQTWIIKLARSIAPVALSSSQQVGSLSRGGFVYIRTNTHKDWCCVWGHLSFKTFYVYVKDVGDWETFDLRKAVSVELVVCAEKCVETSDTTGRPATINMVDERVLMIYGENSKETDNWFTVLKSAMLDVRNELSCQPLTIDNIPVVVNKCIEFITEHGLLSEGIYRRSGSHAAISQLLSLFKADARSVKLSLEEFQIHDVATVLKRFLRTLDDPLLTKALYSKWVAAAVEPDAAAKLDAFSELLAQLPDVNYSTLKHIIFHLSQIAQHEATNLMNVSNLATIFGAVIVTTETELLASTGLTSANDEIAIVRYLLDKRAELFQDQDLEQGRKLLTVQYSVVDTPSVEQADDHILFSIHVGDHDGRVVKMKVSPWMKASEVLVNVIDREKLGNPEDWVLQEVVSAADLGRPIHYSETVVDVSMRWARWPEEFRHNNYLVVRPATLYKEIERVFDPFAPLYNDLKFAMDKTFKKYFFEFNRNTLSLCKDSKMETKIGTWNIANLVIYVGIPLKKNPPSRWGFTFLVDGEAPTSTYFGRSVCCGTDKDLYRWLAAMMLAQHPEGLCLPSKDRTLSASSVS